MQAQRLAWGLMFGLLAVYLIGFLFSWGSYGSWHLLLVIIAILLIYNLTARRGT